jgi:hypothetical protein
VKLAVYTTLYPAMLGWLEEWHESLRRQTDRDFVLWIGLDGLHPEQVEERLRVAQPICWVSAEPGETPAALRNRALGSLLGFCDAVVLVDSDDRLLPDRVEAARRSLAASDLTGCALRLIDGAGRLLGREFTAGALEPARVLPRWNLYGFSNSAIRTALLGRCLPVPPATVLMDWMVATRAWLLGAALDFDPVPRMEYRQHGANTARVGGRATPSQVASDAALVAAHFRLLLAEPDPGWLPGRLAAVRAVAEDVERFLARVVRQRTVLAHYVERLEAAPPAPTLWWNTVAWPPLAPLWSAASEEREYENAASGKL